MALADALGNLIRFVLLPGQRHDSIGVEPLITGLDFEALIGDKAFDHNWLRANLNERGAAAVIPSKADRAGPVGAATDDQLGPVYSHWIARNAATRLRRPAKQASVFS